MAVDYPLEWFDNLIMTRFNVQKKELMHIPSTHCDEIKERANIESLKIQNHIKVQVFAAVIQEKIEVVVRQYHSSLILLYDYALDQNQYVSSSAHLKSAHEHVVVKIGELISFIECWYSKYLNAEDRAPMSYFTLAQDEIRKQLPFLASKLAKLTDDREVIEIILTRLRRFSEPGDQPFSITFKNILYKKELVKKIGELDDDVPIALDYTGLDKLLIYLNYNSKSYIRNMTFNISERVNKATTIADRINQLSLSFKVFNQMLQKPLVKLNPMFDDIDQVMSNWFVHEIEYLEKSIHLSANPLKKEPTEPALRIEESTQDKVMCRLSTDQMALILRATHDLRILDSKSMSNVFQRIVPHLSTPQRKDLSPGSVRSKSYNAEDRDKDIAIETLDKIMKRIQEY